MPERIGDLAVVLHSHMPYVEGFGTYPFGEEWLFDAMARSYLPVLEVADGLTMTITPVLADQLEAPGVAERMMEFIRRFRIEAAEREAEEMAAEYHPACLTEAERHRRSLTALKSAGADLLSPFRQASRAGRIALMASAATHAVLPLLATKGGRRLQIDAGLRSHRRRFGEADGFWLPECGYEPGLDSMLAGFGIGWFCADQSEVERPLDCLAPIRSPAGPAAFTIDWEAVSWLWSLDGYPSAPAHRDFHRRSMDGVRAWGIDGTPYDPDGATRTAREQAREFVRAAAERLGRYRLERGCDGLMVFAIDTELLGHWWWEGPVWLEEVLGTAPSFGVEPVTLPQALERHDAEDRPLGRSTWGEGKDLRTWDSAPVADLAWAARRLELRLVGTLGANGMPSAIAERAARELLALQASDWAFLDGRDQAGDYPFRRATSHARALLEAIHSRDPLEPSIRNLAPDLSVAPLLEP